MTTAVETPRVVQYVAPGAPVIVIQGEFGVPPQRVTINHLPLSIEEAAHLYADLGQALEQAAKERRAR